MYLRIFIVILSIVFSNQLIAQEYDLSGFELSLDQDHFADFLNEEPLVDRNYTVSMRLGFYGALANHSYLGLPWVRQKIDYYTIDNLLYQLGFREERESHNFVFTINGFSPIHISHLTPEFELDLANGYSFANDRPFSSFTGFRSTRRLEGNKLFVHSAKRLDLAVNTSFTFGLSSLGLVQGIENILGADRPDGDLWEKQDSLSYPTGQALPSGLPFIMYSLSVEAVVWRPIKQIIFQIRPELNLGSQTNLGLGFDIGKVLNVEQNIDNLSYTDPSNPGVLVVSNEHLAFAISAGAAVRLQVYNAHLSGLFSSEKESYNSINETKLVTFEAYAGAKLQLFKRVEFNFSINKRGPEINDAFMYTPYWGTFGLKVLLAEEGEGCYD